MRGPNSRWVVHVPIVVPDLLRARILARTAARVLAQLTRCVDVGEVTVSAEDEQRVHHRVFCDRRLAGGARCGLPSDHLAPCATRRNQRAYGRREWRPPGV
ncbi:hypothetical protein [Micromonospora carbonacea]|uniref:Uncharacterized protein n=1 Tax=Micromonospora carbonacea TaxID=47853 RepID=A0A7H8XDX3_9ACTN|nr:hypothetical protein [Micromonospora carbonacea]QLD23243.1 hypothetical protein HXZ27_02540 [Micromonospora carbonacea]